MERLFPSERDRLRRNAEEHAADNAGPKMIQVALDRLLDTVADVVKDMRDEGTKAIQSTSIMLVGEASSSHCSICFSQNHGVSAGNGPIV
jgi:hypothetical protein